MTKADKILKSIGFEKADESEAMIIYRNEKYKGEIYVEKEYELVTLHRESAKQGIVIHSSLIEGLCELAKELGWIE